MVENIVTDIRGENQLCMYTKRNQCNFSTNMWCLSLVADVSFQFQTKRKNAYVCVFLRCLMFEVYKDCTQDRLISVLLSQWVCYLIYYWVIGRLDAQLSISWSALYVSVKVIVIKKFLGQSPIEHSASLCQIRPLVNQFISNCTSRIANPQEISLKSSAFLIACRYLHNLHSHT